MDRRTHEALLASIAHWKRNAADPDRTRYTARDCPLCQIYNPPLSARSPAALDCAGCPVYVATGDAQCRKTPLNDARVYIDAYRRAGCLRRDAVAACQAFIVFLEALLPDHRPSRD